MADTHKNEQMVAAQALLMLQDNKRQHPNSEHTWTFNIPVLKNAPFMTKPSQVSAPTRSPNPPTAIKRKRAYTAPSSPIKRNKGRFAKKESLFVPKPPKKAFTGTLYI